MSKLLIVATPRYGINCCDFHMFYGNSDHDIVKLIYPSIFEQQRWFYRGRSHKIDNRNNLMTHLKKLPHVSYDSETDMLDKISKENFDYLCLGNGNCSYGKLIQEKINTKFLFSEYGFFPHRECFFIDPCPVWTTTELAKTKEVNVEIREDEIKSIIDRFDKGKKLDLPKDYVYVALQMDKDSKMTSAKLRRRGLLEIADKLSDRLVVRLHPQDRHPIPIPSHMTNISGLDANKRHLIEGATAVITINSTVALEALMMGTPVFTYGEDIFSNKGVTYPNVFSKDEFDELSKREMDYEKAKRFISMLLERQVYRHRCSDKQYVKNHFWNHLE